VRLKVLNTAFNTQVQSDKSISSKVRTNKYQKEQTNTKKHGHMTRQIKAFEMTEIITVKLNFKNSSCLDIVCIYSLEDEIRQSAREMGFLLAKISSSSSSSSVQSGQSQQRAAIQQQADVTLQPLMDFLDGRYVWSAAKKVSPEFFWSFL